MHTLNRKFPPNNKRPFLYLVMGTGFLLIEYFGKKNSGNPWIECDNSHRTPNKKP
jgi:hypothetical protein